MKVFLDTNILLDYLEHRDAFFDDALDIFKMAVMGKSKYEDFRFSFFFAIYE